MENSLDLRVDVIERLSQRSEREIRALMYERRERYKRIIEEKLDLLVEQELRLITEAFVALILIEERKRKNDSTTTN